MNLVAHHRDGVSDVREECERADVAEIVEAGVRVAQAERLEKRRGVALARNQVRGAEQKELWQRADLRAEHVQVVGRAYPREHRNPRAGRNPVVERKVRVGAKVEASEEMIGPQKNRA